MQIIFFILTFSAAILFEPGVAFTQSKCNMFNEYMNETKEVSRKLIDSLQNQGIDTILFYGVGTPNTGSMAYGKIMWSGNGKFNRIEIFQGSYNEKKRRHNTSAMKYSLAENDDPLQFYFTNRLDTVHTNPREIRWQSHDYLHFAYINIGGKSLCFTAEDHLVRYDFEHLRSKWIKLLSDGVDPYQLTH